MTDHPRRLVPVACVTVQGEPDGIHLSVQEWLPKFGEYATGLALCGQSAEQGALPDGTTVTCTGCEGYRDSYERSLAGRPTAEQEELQQLRARVADLKTAYKAASRNHAEAQQKLTAINEALILWRDSPGEVGLAMAIGRLMETPNLPATLALHAVRKLHRPVYWTGMTICEECSTRRSTGPRTWEYAVVMPHPCRTVQAIQDALPSPTEEKKK